MKKRISGYTYRLGDTKLYGYNRMVIPIISISELFMIFRHFFPSILFPSTKFCHSRYYVLDVFELDSDWYVLLYNIDQGMRTHKLLYYGNKYYIAKKKNGVTTKFRVDKELLSCIPSYDVMSASVHLRYLVVKQSYKVSQLIRQLGGSYE
jgi:hypothetical protein